MTPNKRRQVKKVKAWLIGDEDGTPSKWPDGALAVCFKRRQIKSPDSAIPATITYTIPARKGRR